MIGVTTFGDVKFKDMLDTSVGQLLSLDYAPIVYDLGGLGYGRQFKTTAEEFEDDSVKNCGRFTFKPRIAIDVLQGYPDINKFICMDADCIMMERVDEVFEEKGWDVAITVRPLWEAKQWSGKEKIMRGYLNSGVVFFRKTLGADFFLTKWLNETIKHGQDQIGLAYASNIMDHHNQCGEIINVDGVKIKLLPTTIYNYYYFNKPKEDWKQAKIFHFKHGMRKAYSEVFSK